MFFSNLECLEWSGQPTSQGVGDLYSGRRINIFRQNYTTGQSGLEVPEQSSCNVWPEATTDPVGSHQTNIRGIQLCTMTSWGWAHLNSSTLFLSGNTPRPSAPGQSYAYSAIESPLSEGKDMDPDCPTRIACTVGPTEFYHWTTFDSGFLVAFWLCTMDMWRFEWWLTWENTVLPLIPFNSVGSP